MPIRQSRLYTLPLHLRWIAGLSVLGLLVAIGVWTQRWAIGSRAVEIVDPAIRRWAQAEVSRLSGGRYQLTSSRIRVDEARRRVSIDTVSLHTDLSSESRETDGLPVVTLQFLGCAMDGIDLDRLTARRGLHAERAGCASVTISAEATAASTGTSTASRESAFLALSENLDLPRAIPFVRVDQITFPRTELALGISGRTGRRTSLDLDQFAVQLDSFAYDPKQPAKDRRPLLARDVSVRVTGFQGTRESANSVVFDSLTASLARGVLELAGFRYEPVPGSIGDSVGVQSLAVKHLALTGVDWRALLTAGDLSVSRLGVSGVELRFPPPTVVPASVPTTVVARQNGTGRTVGGLLRAFGREVRLDSLAVADFTVIESRGRRDSVLTTLDRLDVLGVHFDDRATWETPFPVGKVRLDVAGLIRRHGDDQLLVRRLSVSVPAGTAQIDSLRLGPDGNDAAFQRRHRYRTDRLIFSATTLRIAGLDFPAYLTLGAFRSRLVEGRGIDFDLLTDKRRDVAPGRRSPTRYPQRFLRELGLAIAVDTITLTGEARYREHAPDASRPGTVSFRDFQATLLHFSTDTAPGSVSKPFELVADAKLMGIGAFHFEMEVPLSSPTFEMAYRGSLGAMPAEALNAFAADGAGIRFTSGRVEGIRFEATVSGGRARGRVTPRWQGLGLEFPGMSRKNTGILGGIKRAAAKFIANAFLVRDDNIAGRDTPPRNGVIDHRWTTRETLPQFLWNSVRDPLVELMRK